MSNSFKFHRGSRAFTLVELLTVIAIIGVLAAILIPVTIKVRATAKQATCSSRLRQLGNAFQLYLTEHRGELPYPKSAAGSRWPFHIASYLGAPYVTRYNTSDGAVNGITKLDGSPSTANIYENEIIRDPVNDFNSSNAAEGVFGFNTRLDANHRTKPTRLSELSAPSRFPVLATSEGNGTGGGLLLENVGPSPKAISLGYSGTTNKNGPAPNYGRNAIFLFADWHVEARDVCNPDAWPWNDTQAFDVR